MAETAMLHTGETPVPQSLYLQAPETFPRAQASVEAAAHAATPGRAGGKSFRFSALAAGSASHNRSNMLCHLPLK